MNQKRVNLGHLLLLSCIIDMKWRDSCSHVKNYQVAVMKTCNTNPWLQQSPTHSTIKSHFVLFHSVLCILCNMWSFLQFWLKCSQDNVTQLELCNRQHWFSKWCPWTLKGHLGTKWTFKGLVTKAVVNSCHYSIIVVVKALTVWPICVDKAVVKSCWMRSSSVPLMWLRPNVIINESSTNLA